MVIYAEGRREVVRNCPSIVATTINPKNKRESGRTDKQTDGH